MVDSRDRSAHPARRLALFVALLASVSACGGDSIDHNGPGTSRKPGAAGTGGLGELGGRGGDAGVTTSGAPAGGAPAGGSGAGGSGALEHAGAAGRVSPTGGARNMTGGGRSGSGGKGGRAGAGSSAGGAGGRTVGGMAGAEAGEAGAAGSCDAPVLEATGHSAGAQSSGFSGILEVFEGLADGACDNDARCVSTCLDTQGTSPDFCVAAACGTATPNVCYVPPIWEGLSGVSSEDGSSAELAVSPGSSYHDWLLTSGFGLLVPNSAEILGITATIRRSGAGPDQAVDAGVRLIKRGVMGTVDRSKPDPWDAELTDVDYGGATDLWGTTWTPEDVDASDFGVAVSARYPQATGGGTAYVDVVYVKVSYRVCP